MADLIEREFPDRSIPIADVAAGKGHLKSELYRRGYRNVTCWDRRHRFAKGRPGQRYRLFDFIEECIRADRRRVLEMAAKVSEELSLSTDGSLWASGQLGGFVRQVLEHVAKRISALIEEVCK